MSTKFNIDRYMATKIEYDSLNQAIRLAKTNGAEEKDVKRLILDKQMTKDIRTVDDAKLVKSMPLGSNILHLTNGWCAIRYLNEKNDLSISHEILNPNDEHVLLRDGRVERELSRTELEVLVPGCIDEVALELYKQTVVRGAHKKLYDYCNITILDEEVIESIEQVVRPITVSSHAGMRYVQRKLGIGANNEVVAEEYRRLHARDVEQKVLEGYMKSEPVWTGDDSIVFSLDADNFMYVMGDNNIITLYEEDFGFSKEINRMITLEQLVVLSKARESLRQSEQEYEDATRDSDGSIKAIVDQMEILSNQLAWLGAEKATIQAVNEQNGKKMKLDKSKYSAEFNKLFKKWDS